MILLCSFKFVSSQGTPLTPTANLKVLVAAASSALDREKEECAARKLMFKGGSGGGGASEGEGNNISRKMKSLSLLCKRYVNNFYIFKKMIYILLL